MLRRILGWGALCISVIIVSYVSAQAQLSEVTFELNRQAVGRVQNVEVGLKGRESQRQLVINLTQSCTAEFEELTRDYLGSLLTMTFEGEILVKATVMGVMNSGIIVTTGTEDSVMLQDLATALSDEVAEESSDYDCFTKVE